MRALLLLFLFSASRVQAQSSFLVATPFTSCYAGYDHRLLAVANNCPPEQLALTTDNGAVRKDSAGNFVFRPARIEEKTKVYAYRVRANDSTLLGSRTFRVRYLPPAGLVRIRPTAPSSPFSITIIRDDLSGKTGLESLDGAYLDPRLRITGFDCDIQKEADSIGTVLHSNNSAFSPAMAAAFQLLQDGDRISFTAIRCIGDDGIARLLPEIRYVIREPDTRISDDIPLHTVSPPINHSGDLVIALSDEMNCYLGYENTLFAAAVNGRKTDLRLSTDNGRIYREKTGVFRFVPARKDTIATITGYVVKGRDTIVLGRQAIRIQGLPPLRTHCFGGGINAVLFPREVQRMEGIAGLFDFGEQRPDNVTWSIVGFLYSVKTAATGLITEDIPAYSAAFTPAMMAMNEKLLSGDRLYIDNIQAKGPDGKVRNLGSLTLIVW